MAYDRNLSSINRKLLKGSEVLQESIRECLDSGKSIAVLDIGCGTGHVMTMIARRAPRARIVGLDLDTGPARAHLAAAGDDQVAERCELKSNAILVGDIAAGTLSIEEGATFMGQSSVGKKPVGTRVYHQAVNSTRAANAATTSPTCPTSRRTIQV